MRSKMNSNAASGMAYIPACSSFLPCSRARLNASAPTPVAMAAAFRDAVQAGRQAYRAGLMAPQDFAVASTPVSGHAFVLG